MRRHTLTPFCRQSNHNKKVKGHIDIFPETSINLTLLVKVCVVITAPGFTLEE